jgi:protein-tyrosine phosphatase
MPFPSVMNFRDLGGIRAAGGQWTRAGVVFRTGALCHATVDDARALVERFSLRAYCDFRAPIEISRDGEPRALAEAGVQWHRMPVEVREPWFERLSHPTPNDWAQLYVSMLEKYGNTWIGMLKVLAHGPGPIAFGCAAGKDRTGVAAALLLGCLGVGEEEIIADYARSAAELEPHLERFARYWIKSGRPRDEIVKHFFTTPPEVMESFLAEVTRRWGGVRTALREAGLTPQIEQRLQQRYLESNR